MLKAIIYLTLIIILLVLLAFIPVPFCLEGSWDSWKPASWRFRIKAGFFSYTWHSQKATEGGESKWKRLWPKKKRRVEPALRFLLNRCRLNQLSWDLDFSLGDPAATALAWGIVEALLSAGEAVLAAKFPCRRHDLSHRLICLWQEETGIRGGGRCMFHLAPGYIVITLLILTVSVKDRQGGVKREPAASY